MILTGGTFIHIPRTGGLGLESTYNFSKIWHSNLQPVPTSCTLFTSLRNETDRYCSEWHFYGEKFYVHDKSVKGWIPVSRPKTFEEFAADSSTHNSMVRILSGCQLYDNSCVLTEETVDSIVSKIKQHCITILDKGYKIVHSNSHTCSQHQIATSYRVNNLDRLLLKKIKFIEHKKQHLYF